MWWKVTCVVMVVMAGAVLYGRSRWRSGTCALRQALETARKPVRPLVFEARELQGLPAPVQRYFRTVLQEGQPMVCAATVDHTGTFNMGERDDNWKPFTSTQRVVTQRPGFLWEGRVTLMPGLSVQVHDAYVKGLGVLQAALLGLVTLVDRRGPGEVAEGELMRFFAEAAWYPTALLPSQGLRWEEVDDRSARGTLTEGAITLTLLFTFNEQGLIDTVRAEARGRTVGGQVVPTPWEGRWSNYEPRAGMQVPMQGVVAWLLPEGPRPYWQGQIMRLEYEFAE